MPTRPSPRILIVDDEIDVRATIQDILQLYEYEVIGVGSAEAGLDVLASQLGPINLAVVDLMLRSGGSGFDFARQVRDQTKYKELPMIATSASTYLLEEAKNSGLFKDVIGKPFDYKVLLGQVARLLDS